MKHIFIIAFFFAVISGHAQEAMDTVSLRIQFRSLYKHTVEQKETFEDTNIPRYLYAKGIRGYLFL